MILKTPLLYILELYKAHEASRKNLFARNIRIPKPKVSFVDSIKKTIDNDPKKFFLLHNGLVLTSSNIKVTAGSYILSEPQIINGAQTVGAIYSIYKDCLDDKNLELAHVICKILVTRSEKEIRKICEASNTQKPVKMEDLRTNDNFQRSLEIFISRTSKEKYFYNRKGVKKPSGKIDIGYVKFYQWCYSAFLERPAEAKNARSAIFTSEEYEDLNEKISNKKDEIIRLCDTAINVEKFIKEETDKVKRSLLLSMNLHIIAGMFLSDSLKKSDFKKCYSKLYKFYREEKTTDINITPNKVFTKSNAAWLYLKKELKI